MISRRTLFHTLQAFELSTTELSKKLLHLPRKVLFVLDQEWSGLLACSAALVS